MVAKNRIINETIKLLRWGGRMPIFAIKYTVTAPNGEIEDYISRTTDEYDWDNRRLSVDEYVEKIRERIARFHQSPDFVQGGHSKITLTQCVRISDIGFEYVRDILEGKKTGMVCDYVDDIELVDYQCEVEYGM